MISAFGKRTQAWRSALWAGIQGGLTRSGKLAADQTANLWDRVCGGFFGGFGLLYRPLYWYRDHYERIEPLIIIFELMLIGYGLVVTYNQELRLLDLRKLGDWTFVSTHLFDFVKFTWKHSRDLGEFLIFVVLGISAISRLLISLRGRALGYPYRQIEHLLHGQLDIDEVYARVKRAPWGSSPGGKEDVRALSTYANTIAARTSALLSLRTYHLRDNRWLTRDHDFLLDWFAVFPAALWRLVPEAATDGTKPQSLLNEDGGYYSVIVPTTAASAKHIRRGQKATDLAEVDPEIAGAFTRKPITSAAETVEFLAYLQLHVPRYRRERLADELLFATSIQHLVFLLQGIYGAADGFRAKWNFIIFCEAANSRHGRVLKHLGFVELKEKAHERSEEPAGPGRSYAGFPLFELKVSGGQPHDSQEAKAGEAAAEKFIQLLEELTAVYSARTQSSINAPTIIHPISASADSEILAGFGED